MAMHELKLLPSKFRWYGVGRAGCLSQTQTQTPRHLLCCQVPSHLDLPNLLLRKNICNYYFVILMGVIEKENDNDWAD
jgi:hypothetical protein